MSLSVLGFLVLLAFVGPITLKAELRRHGELPSTCRACGSLYVRPVRHLGEFPAGLCIMCGELQ